MLRPLDQWVKRRPNARLPWELKFDLASEVAPLRKAAQPAGAPEAPVRPAAVTLVNDMTVVGEGSTGRV